MNNTIESDLKEIKTLAHSLLLQEELDRDHKEVVSSLWLTLQKLESFVKKEFTGGDAYWLTAISILSTLHQSFSTLPLCAQKQSLLLKIETVQKTLFRTEKNMIAKPAIGLSIGFFCDFEIEDHNGAVVADLLIAFKKKLPFITTRSLLRCTANHYLKKEAATVEKKLLEEMEDWEVFQQFDPAIGNELIIFIPTPLLHGDNEREGLKNLDFQSDGSLQKISLVEALQGPDQRMSQKFTQAFINLFSNDPKLNKIFYLSGHGNANYVAGLSNKNYLKLLSFFKDQHCKALIVTSCCSGGQSSLINFSHLVHPFNTIVRSIGDFPTFANQEAEKDLDLFIESIKEYLSSPKAETMTRFKKMVERAEGSKFKNENNLLQIYFPHSAGTPGGFRPVNEHSRGFALTYTLVKSKEISFKRCLLVNGYQFLEIHPLVTPVSVFIKNRHPILLSMTPGHAHHYLDGIYLDLSLQEEALEFIYKTINFHQSAKLKSAKAFFIRELYAYGGRLRDVVIHITPTSAKVVWQENDQHFFSCEEGKKLPISSLLYAIVCKEIAALTQSEDLAIRSMSGGQESELLFTEKIDAIFLNHNFCLNSLLNDSSYLSDRELHQFLIFLIETNRRKEALRICQETSLSINFEGYENKSLLSLAIKNGCLELACHLIKNGADVNRLDEEGFSPLHYAILNSQKEQPSAENEELIDFLINSPLMDVNLAQAGNWPPLFYALPNLLIAKKLIDKGACINYINSKTHLSLLGFFAFNNDIQSVNYLLSLAADPHRGSPSPLTLALRSNNLEVIEALLKGGADFYQRDKDGRIPLIEAIYYSFPCILEKVITDRENFLIIDSEGICPLLAALFTGNRRKIKFLRQLGASLFVPKRETAEFKKCLKTIFFRLWKTKDLTGLQDIFQLHKKYTLERHFFNFLINENDFLFIKELIVNKIFFFHKNVNKRSLFNLICHHAKDNYDSFKELVDCCLQAGAMPTYYELSLAVESNNLAFVRSLLEKIDFKDLKNGKTLFLKIISLGDLALVQQAVKAGAKINVKNPRKQPLQQAAKEIKKGYHEIFKWLIAQGADLNASGKDHKTPFGEVILSGNLKMIELSMKNGAKLQNFSKYIDHPLEIAPLVNDPEGEIFKFIYFNLKKEYPLANPLNQGAILTKLIKYGSKELIDWAFSQGINLDSLESQAALLEASLVRNDDPSYLIFKKLLQEGANINACENSQSPLLIVIRQGDLQLTKFCFLQGANLPERLQKKALEGAIYSGNVELLKFLVNEKKYSLQNVETSLFSAYQAGGQAMLEAVYESLPHSDEKNKRLLWNLIIQRGDNFTAKWLFERGMTPFLSNNKNIVLDLAIKWGSCSFLNLMQTFGFSLNSSTLTPYQIEKVIKDDNHLMLHELLKCGLNPNLVLTQNLESESLFQIAFNGDQPKRRIIKLLLDKGVDPCQKIKGSSSLYWAVEWEDADLVHMLVTAGADKDSNIEDKFTGKTPRDLAHEKCNIVIIAILEGFLPKGDYI